MVHRNIFAVVIVSCALTLAWTPNKSNAADTPPATAAQLLDQGLKQYKANDPVAAKATLMRIDPAQLTKDQRVTLTQTLADINRTAPAAAPAAPAGPDAAGLLDQADKAMDKGDLTTASGLYNKVAQLSSATAAQKDTAAARLVEVQQKMQPANVQSAQANLNDALADLKADNLDAAQAKLKAVQDSKVDMGWFDNQRIDRALKRIDERRQELARLAPPKPPAPVVVARPTPTPATPARPVTPATPPVVVAPPTPAPPTPATPPATPVRPTVTPPVAVAPPTPQPPATPPAPPVVVRPVTPPPTAPPVVVKPAPPQRDLLAEAASLAAQEHVAEAQQAERSGDYRLAVQHYQRALTIEPDDAAIKAAMADALAKDAQRSAPGSGGLLQDTIRDNQIRSAEAVAKFKELMNKADGLRRAQNFAGALDSISLAKLILDENKAYIPVDQYQSLRASADNAYAAASQDRIKAEAVAVQEREATAANDATMRTLLADARLRKDVDDLIVRANQLRREQKYQEALQRLNQALFLDPSNITANAMKDMVDDTIIQERTEVAVKTGRRNFGLYQADNEEATIPPNEIMVYPSDWPELTRLRQQGLNSSDAESQIDQKIAAKLREPIPIAFDNIKLDSVIDYFGKITGLNIFVNWTALDASGITKETQVSLKFASIPAGDALKLVLQGASGAGAGEPATYTVYKGLVKISTDADIKATTTFTRVYDIRDLLFVVPTFDQAPQFNLSSALTSSSAGGGSSGSSGSTGGSGGGSSGSSGLFSSSSTTTTSTTAADQTAQIKLITDLIESSVGKKEDWPEFGGTLFSISPPINGSLVVRTSPENHRDLLLLLDQLRESRNMEISYEARFLLVVRDLIDDFGLDIDVTLLNAGKKWFGPAAADGSHPKPIQILQDTISPTNITSIGNTTLTNPAIQLATSFISIADELEVDLLVKATQIDIRNVQLTAPRLTLMNGQTGNITIATQTAFVSDLEPIPDTGGFRTTVSVVNDGVVLQVNGTISADRRYVTMTVEPQLARLVGLVNVPVDNIVNLNAAPSASGNSNNNNSSGNGNNNNNSSSTAIITGNIQLPILEITQLSVTVSVPDKGTIMLGGERIVSEVENEVGVPILSKIPIINRLFTNRSKAKEDQTLLILVKPTIIIQSEQEEVNFPGLNANPEAYEKGRRPD